MALHSVFQEYKAANKLVTPRGLIDGIQGEGAEGNMDQIGTAGRIHIFPLLHHALVFLVPSPSIIKSLFFQCDQFREW